MRLKTSKLFYALLVFYYAWFQVVFFQIPNMLFVLGAGMIGFILLDALMTRTNITKSLTSELILWFLFAFTSLAFGLMVAVSLENLLSTIIDFFEFLFLMFVIVYISNKDRSINFFVDVFIALAITCAITTIFWGVDYDHGRITMGLSNNPNTLGITMALGICCVLFKLNLKNLGYSIAAFSAILLLIYVCLLTGSRKSFLSILLIIIYWFAFVVYKDIKAVRFGEKVKGLLAIMLVLVAGYYILLPYFSDSVLLSRLTVLFESGSEVRESMYSEAFDLFKQSPLVGVGFNNYRALSVFQTYSHSTYAEALACTGIIGCILYFTPYIMLLFRYWKMVTSNSDALFIKQARVMLGMFCVLLFLGVGVIHFYRITSTIAFGMLIAFYKINIKSKSI